VDVAAARTLAGQSRCLKCHAEQVKARTRRKDVAAKYRRRRREEFLYKHVTTGARRSSPTVTVCAHPVVNEPTASTTGELDLSLR
jgi:cytochrome c551/c552